MVDICFRLMDAASALEMFLTPVVAEETMSFTTCLPITIVASGWIMDASVLVPLSDEDEKAALSTPDSLHDDSIQSL